VYLRTVELVHLLFAMAGLLLVNACTGGPEGEDELHFSCQPGTYQTCLCSDAGDKGISVCDKLLKKWSKCLCGSDVAHLLDAKTGDGSGPRPDEDARTGPGPAAPSTTTEMGGGAINLSSPNYKLQLYVAPARPVETIESENYRLRLGPAGMGGN